MNDVSVKNDVLINDVTFAVIVSKGFERVAVQQLREIIGIKNLKDITVEETIVLFKLNSSKSDSQNSFDDVFKFIYMSQISHRVILLIDKIEFTGEDSLLKNIGRNLSNNGFLKEQLTRGVDGFRVSVKMEEHMDVTSLEADIGGVILDYARDFADSGTELKVNLKNPSMKFYVYILSSAVLSSARQDTDVNTAYFGIDFSEDLTKRDYRVFNNAVSLKGPTAFGLLMLAGYIPKEKYLNPSCYSGTLEIEAALYSTKTSHRYYNKSFPFMKFFDCDWDKFFKGIDAERVEKSGGKTSNFSITGSDPLLSSITAAGKNAKIAGMESFVDFRRVDLDWMDIKFDEKSIDRIVSFIPGSSKHDKNLVKGFKQLFYHAEYILKYSGVAVIMCLSKDLLIDASKEYLDLDRELSVRSGGQLMYVLFFKKKFQEKI